jgi:hypothetical protein
VVSGLIVGCTNVTMQYNGSFERERKDVVEDEEDGEIRQSETGEEGDPKDEEDDAVVEKTEVKKL